MKINQLRTTNSIIQAPMAGGITTTELVTAVAESGSLGMIGAGYMSATDLREQITAVKEHTAAPFGVNLFVPQAFQREEEAISRAKHELAPYYDTLQIDSNQIAIPTAKSIKETYEAQIDVVIQEEVSVCSFTFGVPDEVIIKRLQANGITTIGTATTVEEAKVIEEKGLDLMVLQGSEAGGHRGSFIETPSPSIGLMALLAQTKEVVSIPIIASGGLMDKQGIKAAFFLGASYVQLGTAFLLTAESGAHPLHKKKIVETPGEYTVVTSVFSGKKARGIYNTFIDEMEGKDISLAYPVLNALTQPIRKEAKQINDVELMSLWAGQGTLLGREQSVQELVDALTL
ncbi:MAG TPA: nitronate monooxygenase [Pseudogracilibacillus sp.]|nr:nitronate monooxygenase [Pseudogracilibacillus sp.]